MSTWIDVGIADIDIVAGEEIDIAYSRDRFGCNYVTVKVRDVEELLRESREKVSGGEKIKKLTK